MIKIIILILLFEIVCCHCIIFTTEHAKIIEEMQHFAWTHNCCVDNWTLFPFDMLMSLYYVIINFNFTIIYKKTLLRNHDSIIYSDYLDLISVWIKTYVRSSYGHEVATLGNIPWLRHWKAVFRMKGWLVLRLHL